MIQICQVMVQCSHGEMVFLVCQGVFSNTGTTGGSGRSGRSVTNLLDWTCR